MFLLAGICVLLTISLSGSNKPKRIEELRKYDIILTTYQASFIDSSPEYTAHLSFKDTRF